MIRLDRSSAVGAGSFRFIGQTQALFDAACQGTGSCELAKTFYNTLDYRIVQTAFHEAGHATAARSFGGWAQVHLDSPSRGRCYHSTAAGGHQDRCVALSGAIAELLAVYGHSQSSEALCRSVPWHLSDSDRAHAHPFGPSDILECRRHVRALWTEICYEAAAIINQHVAAWSTQ